MNSLQALVMTARLALFGFFALFVFFGQSASASYYDGDQFTLDKKVYGQTFEGKQCQLKAGQKVLVRSALQRYNRLLISSYASVDCIALYVLPLN